MIRKIIQINEEKCNGCGLCASACHEGATDSGTVFPHVPQERSPSWSARPRRTTQKP